MAEGVEAAEEGALSVVRAAGGVVRHDGRVLLVHRPKYDDWAFPKGKCNRAEPDEACALREVEEETGLRCELGPELGSTSYVDPKGRTKVVRYWLMSPLDGEFEGSQEVDEIRWLAADDARELLSYDHDIELLERSALTGILVRHASAGDRGDWDGDDRLRPLDARGRRQAADLVELLRPYEVRRVVSSPYVRCVETVEPLAGALGVPVEEDDRLAEGAGASASTLLAEPGVVACTHGDVVEALLGRGLKKSAAAVLRDGRIERLLRPSS